ncbi:MAG: hypothetical protein ACLQVI_09965 [Polyangiaceae bacterium]
MKLGLISSSTTLAALALAIASTGCSSSSSNPLTSAPLTQSDGGVQPTNEPPHALGTITIGESHLSGANGTFTPQISASFIPDASQVSQCNTNISGCTIAAPAICDGTTGPLCQADQTCTLDASCQPTCQAACTAQCPTGEVCYFPTPSTQACQPIQSFDAGDLIFSGAGIATPVTLIPPSYALTNTALTNPLVWGQEIQITSSGAAGAGFQAFQETVKATTLLQTVPSISTLTAANVYSPAGLALGWTPGSDAISVSVTGPKGTAQCPATDATGAFTVPAAVVSAVAGVGSPAISISVMRQHLEQKTDGKTQGSLSGVTVQPLGYLDLSTISMETTTVEGCGSDTTMCSDGCQDLETSATDCGSCGHSCGSGYCESGTCYGTTGCTSPLTSCSGVCVNLETSNTNCGDCGYACPSTDYCSEGLCVSGTTCTSGYTSCADGCQNLQTSSTDCGSCGNSCDGGTCSSGVCQSSTECSSCEVSAESATCSSQYTACNGDANCSSFESCMSDCTPGNTSCEDTCIDDYSTGATEAQNLQTCICQTACASSCSTNTYCTQVL